MRRARSGFLPGDLNEKVDPYLLPVWDALADTLGRSQLEKMREDGRIEVAPIAFMRGRTLNRAFVIVDEAQNTSRAQMQMVLTRLGEGSRMAVTGDPSQCDLSPRDPSGLPHALDILANTKGVAITSFRALMWCVTISWRGSLKPMRKMRGAKQAPRNSNERR